MPAMKMPGGNSAPKKAPVQATRSDAAEAKKQAAQKAAALKATRADDKKFVKDAKIAAGKVVVAPKPVPIPTPTTFVPNTETDINKSGGNSQNRNNSFKNDEGTIEYSNSAMDTQPSPSNNSSLSESNIAKTPTRNVTDISSLVPQYDAEQIQKILFENLSAIELSKIERHDTIEGINQRYSIISNLSEIRKKYEVIKQLTIMDKFKPLTSIFTINIQDKIPQEDYIILENLDSTYQYLDENNEIVTRERGYYYIDTNGDLVIELINLEKNQQVEVLIDTNGTIYKVES